MAANRASFVGALVGILGHKLGDCDRAAVFAGKLDSLHRFPESIRGKFFPQVNTVSGGCRDPDHPRHCYLGFDWFTDEDITCPTHKLFRSRKFPAFLQKLRRFTPGIFAGSSGGRSPLKRHGEILGEKKRPRAGGPTWGVGDGRYEKQQKRRWLPSMGPITCKYSNLKVPD